MAENFQTILGEIKRLQTETMLPEAFKLERRDLTEQVSAATLAFSLAKSAAADQAAQTAKFEALSGALCAHEFTPCAVKAQLAEALAEHKAKGAELQSAADAAKANLTGLKDRLAKMLADATSQLTSPEDVLAAADAAANEAKKLTGQ